MLVIKFLGSSVSRNKGSEIVFMFGFKNLVESNDLFSLPKHSVRNIRLARFLVELFVYVLIITVVGIERRTRETRFSQLNCLPPTCINMFQAGWVYDPV
jgi:hypothetical protein